jgi:hypothetical protein
MGPPAYIANFDSATAMMRATAAYLRGEDFPAAGMMPKPMLPFALVYGGMVNLLPRSLRDQVYIWSGWGESVSKGRLGSAHVERICQWVVSEYPDRPYPAMMIGSSNGALVNLNCALGIPWLPQSFFLPVARHGVHPDEPAQDVPWSLSPARELLEANPDIVLHHMHDPNQDRLMIKHMAYFRVKKLRLGPAYEQFIRRNLMPGGTIFIVDCTLKWPVTQVQDRHLFQFGALGGADIEEFMHGSERVAEYLARYKSHRRKWEPPKPDFEAPEAEWGFQPALGEDVERFAEEHGYRVRRIRFEQPHDLSPLVADFYREYNAARGVRGNRMIVASFMLNEPYWTIRTGSVPYWMLFNKEPSVRDIARYLDSREPFDEIFMILFMHGTESVGLAPMADWRAVLARARSRGEFLGVTPEKYPRDFAVFARYYPAIRRSIAARYPLPGPVPLEWLDAFLARTGGQYKVQWPAAREPRQPRRPAVRPLAMVL